MQILLINPPIRETFPPYYHPIGLATIAHLLRSVGHEVEIYDINALRYDRPTMVREAPVGDYDWIGISGLITTYRYLVFLIPLLRRMYPNVPIVVGGAGITSAPKTYMENLKPDFGVIGEGEYAALEFSAGKPVDDILGLAHWKGGELVINPPRLPEEDLDRISVQAFGLLHMDIYADTLRHNAQATRELAVFATRGCPFNCGFCYHIFGRKFRCRSVSKVVDEIEFLVSEYGIDSLMMGDECLTANRNYLLEFCQEIQNRNIAIPWSCFSRVDTIDKEAMKKMRAAGCYQIGYGFESGSQTMLDKMGKGVTTEQMLDSFNLAKTIFPRVSVTLIYGYPGETLETVEETCKFLDKMGIHGLPFHIQPYPGTRVYDENYDKIMAQYGSEHEYFRVLGDAKNFVINLTEMSDTEYFTGLARMWRGQ